MRALLGRLIAGALVALGLLLTPAAALADERAMIGVGGTNAAFSAASTTYYLPIGAVGGPVLTSEALAQTTWRGSGVISKIRIKPTTNARSSDTTVCLRIAGVDVVCKTIPATISTEQTDLSTDYTVNDGDTVVVKLTTGTGSGNLVLRGITMEFRTTSGQVFTHLNSVGNVALTVSRPLSTSGNLVTTTASTTVDTGGEGVALESATLSRMVAAVALNASSSATYNSRKNGANGAQSVTVASGAGPTVGEDATNSDSLTAGDTFSLRLAAPGASVTTARVGYRYQGATAGRVMIASAGSANTLTSGNTYYGGPFGGATLSVATTSDPTQAVVPFDAHISKFTAVAFSYAGTANVTIELLKNGASFSPPYTITFNAAGTVSEDTPGTSVAVSAGDTINYKVSGQDGNLVLQWVGFLMTDDYAGSAPPTGRARRMLTMGVGR
jgi:hypothetical protein